MFKTLSQLVLPNFICMLQSQFTMIQILLKIPVEYELRNNAKMLQTGIV